MSAELVSLLPSNRPRICVIEMDILDCPFEIISSVLTSMCNEIRDAQGHEGDIKMSFFFKWVVPLAVKCCVSKTVWLCFHAPNGLSRVRLAKPRPYVSKSQADWDSARMRSQRKRAPSSCVSAPDTL